MSVGTIAAIWIGAAFVAVLPTSVCALRQLYGVAVPARAGRERNPRAVSALRATVTNAKQGELA